MYNITTPVLPVLSSYPTSPTPSVGARISSTPLSLHPMVQPKENPFRCTIVLFRPSNSFELSRAFSSSTSHTIRKTERLQFSFKTMLLFLDLRPSKPLRACLMENHAESVQNLRLERTKVCRETGEVGGKQKPFPPDLVAIEKKNSLYVQVFALRVRCGSVMLLRGL